MQFWVKKQGEPAGGGAGVGPGGGKGGAGLGGGVVVVVEGHGAHGFALWPVNPQKHRINSKDALCEWGQFSLSIA